MRYQLAVIVGSTVLLALAGLWWTSTSNARQDRQLCGVLGAQLAEEVPATTERGRLIEAEVRKLYDQYHCDEGE